MSSSKSLKSEIPSVSESVQALTLPFWLLPMACPVPAIVGMPRVATALETEPDKAVVGVKLAAVIAAPPSMASEQPSPSESRSKLLDMPSLSVSTVQVALGWEL